MLRPIRARFSPCVLLALAWVPWAVSAQTTTTIPYSFYTHAGASGVVGTRDGVGAGARFNRPTSVAVDRVGNIFVADWANSTIRKISQSGEVTTFAGIAGSKGSNDGPGALARFSSPFAVAVDLAGTVYVSDQDNHIVRKISAAGVVSTLAGSPGLTGSADGMGSNARFFSPGNLSVDAAGTVYVADTLNSTVRKITAEGVVTTFAGVAGVGSSVDGPGNVARFGRPSGLVVDSYGYVFVADSGNSTIRIISPDGRVSTFAGSSGNLGAQDGRGTDAQFRSPKALASDEIGNIFVLDQGVAGMVRKIDLYREVTTLAGAVSSGSEDGTAGAVRFSNPFGLAVDAAGSIYIADTDNHVIRKGTRGDYSTPYAFSTIAGQPSAGALDGPGASALFWQPKGVTRDSLGNLYVADTFNHIIRKITPNGRVTTLAGSPGVVGSADGPGSEARFYLPYDLTVDLSGNLYIADQYNHTIRKLTSEGVVTTLAGRVGGQTSGSPDGAGAAARFFYPAGVTVDSGGNVYVADWGHRTIRKVTPAGVVTTLAGTTGVIGAVDGFGSAAQFRAPFSVAVDKLGNVFVADRDDHTIRRVTSGGVVTTVAGLNGISGFNDGTGSTARFSSPVGVAVDAADNVYIAEYGTSTVRKMTSGGVVTLLSGVFGSPGGTDGPKGVARFSSPEALTVAEDGVVFVADTFNNAIRRIATNGSVTTVAGTISSVGSTDGTASEARFYSPSGVDVDASGTLYIADTANHTIRKISGAGNVSLLAGAAGVTGSVNGPGGAARFRYPDGLAVDGAGNVYVADTDNHTIRKITAAGVVATLAGSAGGFGSTNGAGAIARFSSPRGVAVDRFGNVYVADAGNHLIRKITSDGTTTTLAGSAGIFGSVDGNGTAARFAQPCDVAVDAAGNVYVADYDNSIIRKISSAGAVTTLAGVGGSEGMADGKGSVARFRHPYRVAVDGGGFVYVTDVGHPAVRRISPEGVVTTLAGGAGNEGVADGRGFSAQFLQPLGIAVDGQGTVYVTDSNNTIRRGVIPGPTYTVAPRSLTLSPDTTAVFSVSVPGLERGVTYQWMKDGAPIAGATSNTLVIPRANATHAASYTCALSYPAGGTTLTPPATLAFSATADFGRLINLSVLTTLTEGEGVFTVGTVVGGGGTMGTKRILVRAAAPSIAAPPFNVPGTLLDPSLEVFKGSALLGSNNDWGGSAALVTTFNSLGAFSYIDGLSKDAAYLTAPLVSGDYTVQVRDSSRAGGAVIAELYDATPGDSFTSTTPRLINVSVRKDIAQDGLLTTGFVIGGSTARTVLIRAVGPSLAGDPFNVPNTLADPQLTLFSGQTAVASNDNWGGDSQLASTANGVGAFGLSSSTSKDAVLLISLPPATYTAQATGVGGSAGNVILEVYEVP